MEAMVALFWACEGLAAYSLALYGLLAWLASRWLPGPAIVAHSSCLPRVTVLITALDEAAVIAAKIANTRLLDYPADRLEILVVADGSQDATAQLAQECGASVLWEPQRRGKASALNRGVRACQGDVVVFTDANAFLSTDALKALVAPLGDPSVGAVAGCKCVPRQPGSEGESLYWRIETSQKAADAGLWSVMGAAGELLAVRRECLMDLEVDTVLDDFMLTMRLVGRGWRVAFARQAAAFEWGQPIIRGEFERRARIVAGGHQAVARLGWVGSSWRIWWPYLSHRVLRWVAVPWLLSIGLIANTWLASSGLRIYQALLAAQLAFWLAGAIGGLYTASGRKAGLLALPWQLLLYWGASLTGAMRYYLDKQPAAWSRVPRRLI
ncbi:MAG: glycosyltransferase family 2 protein [Cyanobacteria bacterium REEB65]|nr:glycosyltransferase family 2 protein [Cyanobacteria bacterium REEB65]